MNDPRRTGADDDADIELDTQELVRPASQEPLGYGPGEWASTQPREHERAETADSETEQRLRDAEAAIDTLRATTSGLEQEIALMRADLERLRQESEKAAGSKLP
jgi:predicted RNase H-like nuclease (RuvC/YqgF family)